MRIILPFLILGLAAVTFFYFTAPQLTAVDALEIQRTDLTAVLDNATEFKKQQDKLIDRDNLIDPADKANLNEFLPNNIDNVRLIIDINNIAKKSGLTVRNPAIVKAEVKEGETPPPSAATKTADLSAAISFSVSASYDTLKLFLADLARSLRLVDIEALSFTAAEKNLYDYQITLRTYWLK